MSSEGTENQNQCALRICLSSETPVVGCTMDPRVRVFGEGSSKPPPHSLHFKWYRLKNSRRMLWGKLLKSYQYFEETSVEELWIEIASEKTYIPSLEDFNSKLRLDTFATDPVTGNPLSSVISLITEPVVLYPLRNARRIVKFQHSQDPTKTNLACRSSDPFAFSILSYNVLADFLASRYASEHWPLWALVWENRREKLLDEILGYNADIICLQEVQSDHLQNFFVPKLSSHGYSVVYAKKDTELHVRGHFTTDGCAIFYRGNLFKLLYKEEFKYRELVKTVYPTSSLKNDGQFRLLKDNVAAVAVFQVEDNGSKSELCIVNTHIHAQPGLSDVKLLQITTLIHTLQKRVNSRTPILICGDFNSTPTSDCHTFLVKGKIDSPKESQIDPFGLYQILKLEHSLPLASAYAAIFEAVRTDEVDHLLSKMDSGSHEPLFTIVKPHFMQTLDYILYSANYLTVEGLLDLPERGLFKDTLPSPKWPSDHIALMACFRFK